MKGARASWLDPLRDALDAAPEPVVCFVRDDDVGWRTDRLRHLLDLVGELGLPMDLAVIPAVLDARTASELVARIERSDGRLGVHQHGYAHVNHEPSGERKCEFGNARPRDAQLHDIATGRERLGRLLGPAAEPIFTPPWNRCTETTGSCLAELGFEVLSREARAARLDAPELRELPVSVDMLKRRHGARLPVEQIAAIAAAAVKRGRPLGVMLHHAEMAQGEMEVAAELLKTLAEHDRARCVRMRSATAFV